MTTTNKIGYALANSGNSAVITCTQKTLQTGSARESAVVDNTSNLYDDAELTVLCSVAAGTPTAAGSYINVWLAGSEDGTNWPVFLNGLTPITAGGGDAAQGALGSTNNLFFLGAIQCTTSTQATTAAPNNYRQTFSGLGLLNMFRKWSVFIENQTGLAFSSLSSTTDYVLTYTGVQYQNL